MLETDLARHSFHVIENATVPCFDFFPVDDVPDGVEIIGAAVLIFQIIRVFPNVYTKDGGLSFRQRIVLIGGAGDGEFAVFADDEPCPTGTETGKTRGFELCFEFVKAAERGVDGICQAPEGAPPPSGDRAVQKPLWLACPPPLLRTAVRMSSGTLSSVATRVQMSGASNSGCLSRAAFKLVTYAA